MRPGAVAPVGGGVLVDLPVQAGRGRVVLLQPVHADVAPARARILREDRRQRDERARRRPASRSGSAAGRGRAARARPPGRARSSTVFGARVGERLELAERAHLVAEALRRLQLEHRGDLLAELVEPLDAEREAHAALRAELVDQQRQRRAAHVAEQQRGPAGLDDAVGDLADLEVRIDLGRDLDQLPLAPEQVDPLAQVVADHVREASGCPRVGSRREARVRELRLDDVAPGDERRDRAAGRSRGAARARRARGRRSRSRRRARAPSPPRGRCPSSPRARTAAAVPIRLASASIAARSPIAATQTRPWA